MITKKNKKKTPRYYLPTEKKHEQGKWTHNSQKKNRTSG